MNVAAFGAAEGEVWVLEVLDGAGLAPWLDEPGQRASAVLAHLADRKD